MQLTPTVLNATTHLTHIFAETYLRAGEFVTHKLDTKQIGNACLELRGPLDVFGPQVPVGVQLVKRLLIENI
jgi:hypothetical protein